LLDSDRVWGGKRFVELAGELMSFRGNGLNVRCPSEVFGKVDSELGNCGAFSKR
jgi:hypothetical protein